MSKASKKTSPTKVSVEQVLLQIKSAKRNDSVGRISQMALKKGPQAFKTVSAFEILGNDGKHHHWSVTIHTGSLKGPVYKEKRTVTIDTQEAKLLTEFLGPLLGDKLPHEDGSYRIVDEQTFESLSDILQAIDDVGVPDRLELLKKIIGSFGGEGLDGRQVKSLFESSASDAARMLGAGARVVEYSQIVSQLRQMMDDVARRESEYQRLLQNNPWLFGSEYSCLVDRREWTRGDQLDFMLQRTTDGFLEIIEIKTPITQTLFRNDPSHDSWVASAPLSEAVGQVIKYMEKVQAHRNAIIAEDGWDPLKTRARIIIGRDHNDDQVQALRNYNHHLHGIEILTFDQLVRIGERVVSVFETELSQRVPSHGYPPIEDSGIPF